MKKILFVFAALSCAMALSATTYTCHLKVTVNEECAEQDEVPVEVTQDNGKYTLTLKNFILVMKNEDQDLPMPVGNIQVTDVEGINEYGYTTISYAAPILITPGDAEGYSEDDWIGPLLEEVPIDMTARFTDTALSANIDIELQALDQTIGVSLFGVAPTIEGDVNKDSEVTIADVNTLINIILSEWLFHNFKK